MVELYKLTPVYLGEISEEELKFLEDNLEEESLSDEDYYIERETLDFLKEKNISPYLEKLLEEAMGNEEGIEISFKKK